jgi:hypothetical protein
MKTSEYTVLKPRFIWRGTPERRPYTKGEKFAARDCALLRRAVADKDLARSAPTSGQSAEKPAKQQRAKENND